MWIILTLVALLVLGGGITAATLILRDSSDPITSPSASTSPNGTGKASGTPTPTGQAAGRLQVNAPATLAGLNKSTNPEHQTVVDDIVAAVKKEIKGLGTTVAGYYSDPNAAGKTVLFLGITAEIVSPLTEIDAGFKSFNEGDIKIANIAEIEEGKLGGVAKCGDGKTNDVIVVVCAWADNESLGMAVFYNRPVKDCAELFIRMREQASVRS